MRLYTEERCRDVGVVGMSKGKHGEPLSWHETLEAKARKLLGETFGRPAAEVCVDSGEPPPSWCPLPNAEEAPDA